MIQTAGGTRIKTPAFVFIRRFPSVVTAHIKYIGNIKKFVLFLILPALFSCAGSLELSETRNAIAVWNVDNLWPQPGRPDFGELFSDQIILALNKNGKYRVVERKSLQLALNEQNIGSTNLASESTRLRLGRIVGARWMIFGGYFAAGDKMRVDLRIVEVETGKVKKAAQKTTASQDLNDWLKIVREAAEELL